MVRNFEQVSIFGKLPKREITLYVGEGKARCLTCESFVRGIGMQKTTDWIMEIEDAESERTGECFDAENPNSETRRGRKMTDKSNCLMAQNDTNFMKYEGPRIINLFGKKVRVLGIRRLTPTECARLQTIPEWYKWECSDSQAYRMLGNGWTVEVIKHIFSFLPDAWKKKSEI